MTTAQKVLQYAAHEIGTKETGHDQNKYGRWYGQDGAPWCAMFVSYCFYNTGLPLPAERDKGFAYCGNGIKWFKSKGLWHTTPQVGDVVFYNWHDGGDSFDHVGIVEKVNADGSIVAIEGNTKTPGQVARRNRSSSVIIGCGRPAYTGSSGGSSSGETVAAHSPWPGRYIALTSPFMNGEDILLWQRQMIHRGWSLNPDSIFDESDHDVLIKFQKEKGLEVDGKIGPMSWNAAWESSVTSD